MHHHACIGCLLWSFFTLSSQYPSLTSHVIVHFGHPGPNTRHSLIAYQLRKYFLTPPSPERIFLSTLDTAYQITLGSPVTGPIFSTHCQAAWDCDVTSTVDKCCLLQKLPVVYFLLSINRFNWLQVVVAWVLAQMNWLCCPGFSYLFLQ
jgi:hypothetical protein